MSQMAQRVPPELGQARERFLDLVAEVRPELHRYCARLTGSVVDGEDIVQEALARAFYALSLGTDLPPLRPWLFRVAHNAAVDHLRRYEQRHVEPQAEVEVAEGGDDERPDPLVVRAALGSFLSLPVVQRSAVVLKDVLGHSLAETADTMGSTVPAVKAALWRGRAALKKQRQADAGAGPPLDGEPSALVPFDPEERRRLSRYAALFNARDWEGLKALLAEECRLDLVSRAARRGQEVHGYFARYAAEPEVALSVGTVEGRPALLLSPQAGAAPAYFLLLRWEGERVALIRDYRYAPYVIAEASLTRVSAA